MVRAGGLATIGINYYDPGYQTGLMAIEILENEADIPPRCPLNRLQNLILPLMGMWLEEIGLTIPEDLAEYVIKEQFGLYSLFLGDNYNKCKDRNRIV